MGCLEDTVAAVAELRAELGRDPMAREIGDRLGISEAAAYGRLNRCRKKGMDVMPARKVRKKTPEEKAWIVENAPRMTHAQTKQAFRDRFGWELDSVILADFMQSKGMHHVDYVEPWTDEMKDHFREIAAKETWQDVAASMRERYGIELTRYAVKSRRAMLGVKCEKLHGAWGTGKPSPRRGMTWDQIGISKEDQARIRDHAFKKGHVPHNAAPVGAERLRDDGYIEVKVREHPDRNPHDNWVAKHNVAWCAANGMQTVPKGHIVVFADRDNRNFDPGNLVLVSRPDWGTIIGLGMQYSDRETLESCVALAKVIRKANERAGKTKRHKRRGEC